jgi:hypothetical protein
MLEGLDAALLVHFHLFHIPLIALFANSASARVISFKSFFNVIDSIALVAYCEWKGSSVKRLFPVGVDGCCMALTLESGASKAVNKANWRGRIFL